MTRFSWAAAVLLAAALTPASPAAAADRFSFANGCYAATDPAGKPVAEKVRMKPTSLGRYLLYLPDGRFVAAGEDGSLGAAAQPSPAADLAVEDAGDGLFTLTPASTDAPVATVRFAKADGCAEFPEAPLNATGSVRRSSTEYSEVDGIVEGHMHWMAFQYFGGRFHCGAPWHAYGIAHALPDCSEVEGPGGTAAPFQNLLNYGNPGQPHDTSGYPKLTEWRRDNLTYDGVYYRWVERVWKAGLRLMVMGVNENRVLCELQTNRIYDCNEMNTMRRGFKAIRQLQDYV
ncbi:MAG: Coagulation factor 5/8 type domain-containing protein, partial [Actinomycetes bacterium]